MECRSLNTTGPDQKLVFWLVDLAEQDYIYIYEHTRNGDSYTIDVDYRIDDDEAATLEWEVITGTVQIILSGTRGIDAHAFLDQLRGHNRLRLRLNHVVYDFTITDLFRTPVQINIDECGNYNPVVS